MSDGGQQGAQWIEDADLGASNTLRLPCRARTLVTVDQERALQRVLERVADSGQSLYVLGGGSNVVLPPFIDGVVLRYVEASLAFDARDAGVRVTIGAGANWDACVRSIAARGLWGTENLALIPGLAGAAPVQNIGAYGQELAERCTELRVLDRRSGRIETLAAADCGFAYRDSRFRREPGRWLILALVLQLSSEGAPRLDYPGVADALGDARPTPSAVADAVTRVRRARLPDPERMPNAGSFFKNPVLDAAAFDALLAREPELPGRREPGADQVKVPAAWLIERCGWRGVRRGAIGVSERHALVLVHHGGGDGTALLAFAAEIEASVADRFGIRLEREPVRLGWGAERD